MTGVEPQHDLAQGDDVVVAGFSWFDIHFLFQFFS
jgi:hypothetical protein